jgi:SAM-dependent methyltransferase
MFAVNGILFNHESPRRGETFVTRKISRAAAAIKFGRQRDLYLGNLEAVRDWGYAPEYVEGMWRMLQADEPHDYVLATGEGCSVRAFVESAFEYVGLDWREHVRFDERYLRPTEVDALIGDARRAEVELGRRAAVRAGELAGIMVDADLARLDSVTDRGPTDRNSTPGRRDRTELVLWPTAERQHWELGVFDIITKKEYWQWQDAGLVDAKRIDLKGIQDAYILSRLDELRAQRILEIGGGNSRVLSLLSQPHRGNECWNADRFEGVGAGPLEDRNPPSVRVARCFLGEFDRQLPSGYFDFLFSVCVVEHVPTSELEAFMADSARVLRPGGQILHAIDLYVHDSDNRSDHRRQTSERIAWYLSFAARPDLRLRLRTAPAVDEDVAFRCSYASNTDLAMNQWNRVAPALRPIREVAQSVSIKAEWIKY